VRASLAAPAHQSSSRCGRPAVLAERCELLRAYVDDPDLGAMAITAIKSLNDARGEVRPEPDFLSREGRLP
jgi:hypothetical protein